MARDDDARGEIVAANGIDIYVERSGEGPRLAFLNGSSQTLDGMRPLLGALAGRFELVGHDQRGLGRTETLPGPTRWPTTRPTPPRCSTTSAGTPAG